MRDVCDLSLYDPSVSKQTQRWRAEALGIVGEVYGEVQEKSA